MLVAIVSACSSRGRNRFDIELFAASLWWLCPASCRGSDQSRTNPLARLPKPCPTFTCLFLDLDPLDDAADQMTAVAILDTHAIRGRLQRGQVLRLDGGAV